MPTIALFFASLHTVMMLLLASRVAMHRRAHKIGIGDGGDHRLLRKVRAHGNFVEYVPMALLMLALLELSGLQAVWLWVFGGNLFAARLLHAFGLSRKSGHSPGRFLGILLTWVAMIAMAGTGAVLAVANL